MSMKFIDFRENIKTDLMAIDNDAYLPDSVIDKYIKRAYSIIGDMEWTETQKVQYRVADAQDEGKKYFGYPDYWVQDSVFRVVINNVIFDKINWRHYKEKGKLFSEYRDKIHIPIELNEGDEIEIHGHQKAWWVNSQTGNDEYDPTDNDKSIFRAKINEIITQYATGMIFKRMQGDFFSTGVSFIKDAESQAETELSKNPVRVYTGDADVALP